MGWKSTIDITVSEAKQAIAFAKSKGKDRKLSKEEKEELEMQMHKLGIGDDPNLPYFGHNFNIHND